MTDIDLQAEVDANPSDEADAPKAKPGPAQKDKAAARKKANAAKKKAADKVKAKAAAARAKEAAKVKAAKEADRDAAKALVAVNRDCMVQVKAGQQAIHMGQKSLQAWSVAAFNLNVLCKDNKGVNFKDMALEHWGVDKNTASKLAKAGEMVSDLLASEGEKGNWLPHLPQNNLNTLSMIARLEDSQIDAGIDQEIIHPKATEKAITDYANTFRPVIEGRVIPSTEAADAEDAAAAPKPETAGKMIARIVKEAATLTPANHAKLLLALTADMSQDDVITFIDALEVKHSLVDVGTIPD